jgi:hypothetical protein
LENAELRIQAATEYCRVKQVTETQGDALSSVGVIEVVLIRAAQVNETV